MHLGLKALNTFFEQHREKDALVLATVVGIQGSSYRKPGAMMLISADGDYAGMISGGCLEADLLEHAAAVFQNGEPAHVTYDMYADEQLVWGLGLGCDGVINLLLQRLDRQKQFEFLPFLFKAQGARLRTVLALVTSSDCAELAEGAVALSDSSGHTYGSDMLCTCIDKAEFAPSSRYLEKSIELPGGRVDVLLVDIQPAPKILVCGAGPDAGPITQLVTDLGWECVVVDHRAHYAQPGRFPAGASIIQIPAKDMATAVDLTEIDAAVIMSHHLENDLLYLDACLGADGISYIGILGPSLRREKLLARCKKTSTALFGPVGLDIGAELPESIALSAVAEIHAVLNGRSGGILTKC